MFNLVDTWTLITEETITVNPRRAIYETGDYVIINIERNNRPVKMLSRVIRPNYEKDISRKEINSFPLIKRLAADEDIAKFNENQQDSINLRNICRVKAAELSLKMNIFKAAYSLDNKLILFLYTAPGQVDFRELLKRLISEFRKRIELRQVGERDEAKILSGIGKCGMELCCHRFLYNFNSVSIKDAKLQHLSLNADKITGVCGKLLCCIAYESNEYRELNKDIKHEGDHIDVDGEHTKILNVNVFSRTYTVEFQSGAKKEIKIDGGKCERR